MTFNCSKCWVFAFLALTLLFPRAIFADETKKIVVLPFDIHSKSDADYLKSHITSEITAELMKQQYVKILDIGQLQDLIDVSLVNQHNTAALGRRIGADYVVMGSLTRLGNLISADVQVFDVEQNASIRDIYAQGTGLESIHTISSSLVREILFRLFAHQRIAKVQFTGNRRVEESALYNIIKSTKGTLFSKNVLSADIKTIFKMGFFEDVRTIVEDSSDGKTVTFIVKERPLIQNVEIRGYKKIDRDDIDEVVTIKPRQIYNPEKVKTDAEHIKNLYREKGYLNAEVTYSTEGEEGKDVTVAFTIVEHKRPYIKSISFEGNKVYTNKELRGMMEVSEWGIFHFLTDSGLLNRNELKKDIEKLTAFYHNNGYINAQIGDPEIKTDEKWIYVTIPVIEGKQFRVGHVDITGDILSIPRSELMKGLQIVQSGHFDREAIVRDMDYLTGACNNEGYAYASVFPETTANEEKREVDVIYHIDKDDLTYINRIAITGNSRTRDKVIRRLLQVVEGELYNRDKLKGSYNSLNQLRYFEEVNFQTGKGPEESLMDIDVHVKEKSTGLFSVGAGYSAQENAVFMAQIQERNLFGKGQTLSLNAHLGSSTTNYELSFVEPWLFDIPLWSKFKAWDMAKEYDTYDVDTQGFGLVLGYHLFERVSGYVQYEFAFNNIRNVASYASRFVKEQEGEITSSGVTVSLVRDTKNDWIFPSRGSKHTISLEYTGSVFQGDANFIRYRVDSRLYFSLPWNNVLAIGGQMGVIRGHGGKDVPIYERYYIGGINTLRGLRDVGPRDPVTGEVLGGVTMLVFNSELIFPLIEDAGIRGVVFFDTGNSWSGGYHLNDMRETAGVGIRWNSPLGPFRLEWGHVLDPKGDEAKSRWEFTIGMAM